MVYLPTLFFARRCASSKSPSTAHVFNGAHGAGFSKVYLSALAQVNLCRVLICFLSSVSIFRAKTMTRLFRLNTQSITQLIWFHKTMTQHCEDSCLNSLVCHGSSVVLRVGTVSGAFLALHVWLSLLHCASLNLGAGLFIHQAL